MTRRRGPLVILVLLVSFLAGALELRHPNYFLWDDNAAYFLPAYVYNWRSLVQSGSFPELNLHQYLGYQYLGGGQPGALYPPVYVALGLSRLLLGDLRHAVDLLAIGHLLAAALGMYVLLTSLRCRASLAGLGAMLWVSFPFLVQVSRNWVFVPYTAAYLPFNLLLLERVRQERRSRHILALGAVKALLFLQGYVQYAILVALFDGVWLLGHWLVDRDSRATAGRQLLAYLGAVGACSLLAAPFILPVLYATSVSAYRTSSLTYPEFLSNTMPLAAFAKAQVFWMSERAIHLATGAIFFFGLPNLLLLLALPVLAASKRRSLSATTWVALGIAAIALLSTTVVYGLLYRVPVLSSFRWPFKHFLVFLFFAALALVLALDQLAVRGAGPLWRRRAPHLILVLGIASNLAVDARPTWNRPFGPNRIDRDVAEITAEVRTMFPFEEGRVVSLWLSPLEPHLERLQVFNYSTLVGAYHLGGYEPLIAQQNLELAMRLEYSNIFRYEITPEVLAHLSSWSVRFLLVPERESSSRILAAHPQLVRRATQHGVEIWENRAALPPVHFLDEPGEAVDFEWGVNEIRIRPAGRGGRLAVAVAPLPWYSWTVDGRAGGAIEIAPGGQLVLDVPPGAESVSLRFRDLAFRIGCGLALALVLPLLVVALRRRLLAPRSRGSVRADRSLDPS